MTINTIIILLSATTIITIGAVALAFIYIYSLRRQIQSLNIDIDFLKATLKTMQAPIENRSKIYEEIKKMLSDDGTERIDIDALYAALSKANR